MLAMLSLNLVLTAMPAAPAPEPVLAPVVAAQKKGSGDPKGKADKPKRPTKPGAKPKRPNAGKPKRPNAGKPKRPNAGKPKRPTKPGGKLRPGKAGGTAGKGGKKGGDGKKGGGN